MESAIKIEPTAEAIRIAIDGTFGTLKHTEFAEIYRSRPREQSYILDFSKVNHIDSGGIGMLLLMREYLGNRPKAIQITQCNHQVKEILAVAKIDSLIPVS